MGEVNCPFLNKGTLLRLVLDFYRAIALDSMDVEPLMSAFTYVHAGLTQQRKAETFEKVVLHKKELPSDVNEFDVELTAYLFMNRKERKVPTRPILTVPSGENK